MFNLWLFSSGLTKANSETRFLLDIYVLKTMIYSRNRVFCVSPVDFSIPEQGGCMQPPCRVLVLAVWFINLKNTVIHGALHFINSPYQVATKKAIANPSAIVGQDNSKSHWVGCLRQFCGQNIDNWTRERAVTHEKDFFRSRRLTPNISQEQKQKHFATRHETHFCYATSLQRNRELIEEVVGYICPLIFLPRERPKY